MNNTHLSFTVGIPSYKSGPAILKTVESLQASEDVGKFEIIVMVDEFITKDIARGLRELGVRLIINKKRGGQTAVNRQIGELVKTDLLIMTQDDVLFEKDTLPKLISAFQKDKQLTMAVPRYVPLPARTWVERGVQSGVRLVRRVIPRWNNGDNYLSAVGRCLAYRTKMYQSFEIDDRVINCDAYYYFENKRLGGTYTIIDDAVLYFRTPSTVEDHLKQVRKFVVSESELSTYLKEDMGEVYAIPRLVILSEMFREFVLHPIDFVIYIGLTVYARTRPKSFYAKVTRFWDVDASTKG